MGLLFVGTRPGQRHVDVLDDPARACRHHAYPIGEQHRLGHRVRDEEDRLRPFAPDAQQLQAHFFPGERVQGAEGFVHQEEVRVRDQGPADGSPLLHAPESSEGIFRSKSASPTRCRSSRAFAALPGSRRGRILSGNRTLLSTLAQGEKGRRLEHHSDVASRPLHRDAVDGDPPRGGRQEPRDQAQQGGLAAPGRADDRDELVALDVEAHLPQGQHVGAVERSEALRDVLDLDDRARLPSAVGRGPHPHLPGRRESSITCSTSNSGSSPRDSTSTS